MAFDIKIKPLVLFDLEDKIRMREHAVNGEGKHLYQTFLAGLCDLQSGGARKESEPVYESVLKYVSKDALCSLFYTVTGNTVLVVGML